MELLTVKQVAALLQVGERSVWRFRDSGRMPKALVLGRCVRWKRSEIEAWVSAGCPDVRRTGWTPAAGK